MSHRKYKLKRHFTELGESLMQARVRNGLTQREVSQELGYSSAQFISNFERGISAPPLKKIQILARRYKLPIGQVARLLMAGLEKKILEALNT